MTRERTAPRLIDAHTHWEGMEDLEQRSADDVFSLLCARTVREYGAINAALDTAPRLRSSLFLTAGLHPWLCEEEPVEAMLSLFPDVEAVGEIGMDSVWCSVDPGLQRRVFVRQLEEAHALHKPVILHTKGQEAEIASIIRNYPNRYLVHWYSCDRFAEQYVNQDCYFTIGPDVLWNEATRSLARLVPSDRILVETDGMSSVAWARKKGGCEAADEPRPSARKALSRSLEETAALRRNSPEELALLCERNLEAFLGHAL